MEPLPHDRPSSSPPSQGTAETARPAEASLPAASTRRSEGFLALSVAALYLLFWQITLRIPSSHIAVVWTTTLVSLGLTLLFTVRTARALQTPRALILNLLLSGALALPAVLLPILATRFPEIRPALLPFARIYFPTLENLPGAGGLLLIWFASALGALLARVVREIKILLPMAVALACIDLYVVFGGGLVAQANTGQAPVAQAAMQALTVKLPRPEATPPGGAAPMQLAVGFADYLFVALFFACFLRFGVPSRRTFFVLCGVLAAYMFLVGFFGLDLPALVPIAVVVIGMNLRHFRYERSEAFALLYAALIVGAMLAGLFFFSRK